MALSQSSKISSTVKILAIPKVIKNFPKDIICVKVKVQTLLNTRQCFCVVFFKTIQILSDMYLWQYFYNELYKLILVLLI